MAVRRALVAVQRGCSGLRLQVGEAVTVGVSKDDLVRIRACSCRAARSAAVAALWRSVTERSSPTPNPAARASSTAYRTRALAASRSEAPLRASRAASCARSASPLTFSLSMPVRFLQRRSSIAFPVNHEAVLPHLDERLGPPVANPGPAFGRLDEMFGGPVHQLRQPGRRQASHGVFRAPPSCSPRQPRWCRNALRTGQPSPHQPGPESPASQRPH